jgi:DNA (cytosine-5)-methyltransferase 1
LRGYFAEGRAPWQGITPNAERGTATNDCEIPYTLIIRSGVERDSKGKAAGKGALIQKDKSATLSTVQDQYLFQPVTFEPGIAQREGGHIYEGVSGTLRANAGDNQMAVAFDAYNQVVTGSVAKSLTAKSSDADHIPVVITDKPVYSVENHPADSRVNLDESGKVQTLTGRMGTGGGNVPMIMEPFVKSRRAKSADDATTWKEGKVANTLNTFDQGETRCNELVVGAYCLQGSMISRDDKNGPQGDGVNEDASFTLNTVDRHAVAYGLDRASYNQGKNAKFDFSVSEEQSPTLVARDPGAVVHASKASFFMNATTGAADTLVATDYKDPQLIAYEGIGYNYVVRRLTPTECARLQGFADRWGNIDAIDKFTQKDYQFWLNVRNTHAMINGREEKDYTVKQMLTWYNKLQTDSAEYKMWGNGIALPPALYCMQGIVEVLSRVDDADDSWMR